MKTVSTLLILLALFAAGCGSDNSESIKQNSEMSALNPPQPEGVNTADAPPSPPDIR